MLAAEIPRLRRAADRLRRGPYLLLRSHANGFLKLLSESPQVRDILQSLETRVGPSLGQHHSEIFDRSTSAFALDFAPSLEQRALLGHRVLQLMFETSAIKEPTSFSQHFAEIGGMFARSGRREALNYGNIPPSIETFVEVLIDPILDYLEFSVTRADLLDALMVRYKHRSEWFRREHLLSIAGNADSQVEQHLKLDFYEYLFDNDVEFQVAPESPADRSKADVLSARFPDGSRLVCEAKVFDGRNRDQNWVSSGIGQAASYAHQWGEPAAYLLVYDIKRNSRLGFLGTQQAGDLWICENQGKRISMVVLDLGTDVPASRSQSIEELSIQC